MNTESRIEIDTIENDTREVAAKLSFLVGKTVLFRDGHEDACTSTQILAVKVANGKSPIVSIYTTVGIQNIDKSEKFGNIMLLDEDGGLESLGEIVDRLGIYF